MPADVSIRFRADSRDAQRQMQQLQREVKGLQQGLGQAGQAADTLSNDARKAAVGVTSLGRQIFATSAEARKFNGVFVDSIGKIREANGRYAKAGETVDKLGTTFRRTTPQIRQFDESLQQSTRSTGILTGGLGSLRNVLGGIGIAVVTHQLGQLAISSVQAAGSLEQLTRATTQIEGSAEAAEARISALIQVANLPGLQFEPLVRYSNRLRAAGIEGQDVDTILLSVGQTIVSLGGSAATAELAMEQLIQAIAAGKVDMRDFRTIIQQIPGFLEAMGDVHGVEANIDGLKEAFDRTGGSIRDLVIPTFEELSRRFEAPPTDSYIVAMDTLENAFRLAQASIGSLFLPTIVEASQSLTAFFEAIRAGVDDVTTLPEPIQEIVRGAMALYEALQNVGESIGSVISPPVQELASQLANLIGEVLGLVGAIYNSLEPVFKGLYAVIGTVVAAVAQLVEHISLLVGGLTTAVNWVTQFWTEEERAAVSTDKLTAATEQLAEAQEKLNNSGDTQRAKLKGLQTELDETSTRIERYEESLRKAEDANNTRDSEFYERRLKLARERVAELSAEIATLTERYGGASAALGENATAAEQNVARLKDLQTELDGVNQRLAEKQARFDELIEKGANPAHASMEQLTRQITALQAEADALNTEIGNTATQLDAATSPMDAAAGTTENFSLALAKLKANAEDTRESLSETVDIQQLGANYSAAIAASDAYYAVQIANAEAALAKEEENSEAYQQIETDLFNLRREQVQARERLTQQAAAVGEAEAQKRIETAEAESEALQKSGEETARALTESQKQQTAASAAEQQRLTDAHETALQEREAAQQASNERIVENSEAQLESLQNAFQNALPAGVDHAYSTIQQATIEHYAILKSQARTRITDEDALNSELVSLDRQRNAELQDNHRAYLQRIVSDAKDLLGDRTDTFREASDTILHDWERTVSEFERRLREADTEEAIQQIESEFTEAQGNMLDSLNQVLIELGFTADQAAEIMTGIFQTAESETDSFADKVISAFKRLGREADRETKKQNREIERSYRELVREIEDIVSGVTGFFLDIANDTSIEEAFKNLGVRIGNAVLSEFEGRAAQAIAKYVSSISNIGPETAGVQQARQAAESAGLTVVGTGAASAGSLVSTFAPISAAGLVFLKAAMVIDDAANKFTGRVETELPDPAGVTFPQGVSNEPQGFRLPGESDEAFQRRIDRLVGIGAPTAPTATDINQAVSERAAEIVDNLGIDQATANAIAALESNLGRGLNTAELEKIFDPLLIGITDAFNTASDRFRDATGSEIEPAFQDYITATNEFFDTQISNIQRIGQLIGLSSFDIQAQVAAVDRERQGELNEARASQASPSRRRRRPGERYNATTGRFESTPTAGSESGAPEGSQAPEAPVIDLESLQTRIASRVANDALDAIRTAADDANVTEQTILDLWAEAQPALEVWYQELLDDANEIENEAERNEALAALGNLPDFIANLKGQYVTPIINGIQRSAEALETRTATREANDALGAIREAATDANITEQRILDLWTDAQPFLENWYQELLDDANAIENDAERNEALTALGSLPDFIANLKSQYVTPIVTGIRRSAEALQTRTATREANDALEAIRTASEDANVTEQTILDLWTNAQPFLETWYQELLDDANAIENDAERGEALAALGSLPDFIASLKSQYVTPVINSIQSAAESLQTRTATREANEALQSIRTASEDVNVTESEIIQLWTDAQPFLETWYQELLDDANAIENDAERGEAVTALGSLPDFIASLKSQYVTPIISRIQNAAESLETRTANRLANDSLSAIRTASEDANVTEAEILQLWETATPVNSRLVSRIAR